MPANLPLQTTISQSSQNTGSYKVLAVQYGNGYKQRAGDGINNNVDTWTLNWDNMTLTDYTTLTNAIDSAGGVDYFYWQAPTDTFQKKWVVTQSQTAALAGQIYSVALTLEQDFSL